jgi:hypothetical protein
VTRASREAIHSIEGKGGKVTTVYYNKLSMKYLFNPEQFGTTRRIPRAALPVRRYLIGIPYFTALVFNIQTTIRTLSSEAICPPPPLISRNLVSPPPKHLPSTLSRLPLYQKS